MMPITPRGTRMRPTSRPLGRRHIPVISPTGSGRSATCRSPRAMPSRRARVRVRRSTKAAGWAAARAPATSSALAARMRSPWLSSPAAMAWSAAFFVPPLARASSGLAARASRAIPRISHWFMAIRSLVIGRESWVSLVIHEDHQIVPVNHLVVWLVPEGRRDLVRFQSLDLLHLVPAVVHQAPGELLAVRIHQADDVARAERPACRPDAGGQQALPPGHQRLPCAVVHHTPPAGLTREGEPALPALHPAAGRNEKGADVLASHGRLHHSRLQAARHHRGNARRCGA